MQLEDYRQTVGVDLDEHVCLSLTQQVLECAEKGSMPAKLFMGNVYWYGDYCCPQDKVRSASFYEDCARSGNARAQCIMASNYCYGDGVEVDYDLAVMYANLSLEQKYVKSLRLWGDFYCEGLVVGRDYAKAREYYEQGIEREDYHCHNKIGDMHYFGWGTSVDYVAAVECYKAAEKATPPSKNRICLCYAKEALGRCYELGQGVEKDLAIAADKYLEGYQYGNQSCREAYLRCSHELKGDRS